MMHTLILLGQLAERPTFRMLDVIVIIGYLLGMAGVGLYFARRNNSTEEYFVGNRSFPGWVIGLSMLGTTISSVTFLAFPGDAYATNWSKLVANLTLPLVAILAILVFIPFFRRGNLTSAFEYLEARYGTTVRFYGVLTFIIAQTFRLARILFLVCLPVQVLTGAPLWIIIVCTGIFIAFYTVAGGIEAVIWTDVAQAIVLLFGGLVCVAFVVTHLPGGFEEIFSVAQANNKFSLGSFEFDWGQRTFWTVSLLGIFTWLFTYSGDQNVIQRYASARSTRDARKAAALFSIVAVPTWALFFFVGTCVFVYYQRFPNPAVDQLATDAVFPHFIFTTLPAGLAGLVIAGVLAAAMSSLDSSINAIATVTVVDIVRPYLAPGRSDRFYLLLARIIATLCAGVMIVGAIIVEYIPKESMNDLTWIIESVFNGCLMAVFMIGFFTTRVGNRAAILALVVAVGVNVYLAFNWLGWVPSGWEVSLDNYWVGPLVNVLFAVLAIVFSFFVGRRDQQSPGKLQGLTVWTMGGQSEN
ncbi:MAG: sodium:solute symporter [Planctomycetaceae bacterium]|nr:sodium:solute symporter [Planctomycetaceae bacterium]